MVQPVLLPGCWHGGLASRQRRYYREIELVAVQPPGRGDLQNKINHNPKNTPKNTSEYLVFTNSVLYYNNLKL